MRDEIFIFEKLDVYQKSLELSVEICKLISRSPYKYSRIRDQLIGAIISIPLNIAEGSGRQTVKDIVNFYKIARSSSFECIPLIEICVKLELIDDKMARTFKAKISDISRMLSGLIRYHKKK